MGNFCFSKEPPACHAVVQYALKKLPNWGFLRHSEGFVYVEVDEDYIQRLIGFIKDEGFEEPPYFGKSNLVGAHITVIYPDEMIQHNIQEFKESGENILFTARDCKIVNPPRWNEIEEVYFLVVEAPQLDMIRKHYGLPKREFDFHITIGVKPKILKAVSH